MNKTEILLLAQFESPIVPLEKICVDFFGLGYHTAKVKACAGTLPIPAFKLGKSKKTPWQIHIKNLAQFIEQSQKKAEDEWIGDA